MINGKPLQTAGAPNWPLAKGDRILTGTASTVISFPDGARLTLAPNTKVLLNKCDSSVMSLFQGSINYSTPAKPNLEFCALGHAVRPVASSSEGSVSIESPSKVVVRVAGQEQAASAAKCSCEDRKKAPIIWATAGGAGVAAATVATVTSSSK